MMKRKKHKADIDPKNIESIKKFFDDHYDYTSFELRHKYDIPISTLNYWRRKAGIPRNKLEIFQNYKKEQTKVKIINDPKIWNNGPWFIEMYVNKELGAYTISRIINRSVTIVYRRLKKYGIPIREHKKAVKSNNKYKDQQWLWTQYIKNNRSLREIANEAGVNRYTICHWLAEFNIPIKSSGAHATIRARLNRIRKYQAKNGTSISKT